MLIRVIQKYYYLSRDYLHGIIVLYQNLGLLSLLCRRRHSIATTIIRSTLNVVCNSLLLCLSAICLTITFLSSRHLSVVTATNLARISVCFCSFQLLLISIVTGSTVLCIGDRQSLPPSFASVNPPLRSPAAINAVERYFTVLVATRIY